MIVGGVSESGWGECADESVDVCWKLDVGMGVIWD